MMNTLRFEQLREGQALSRRELEQVAALIYDTDPFIYPALFFSREQAIRVLPTVFLQGGDNMFCLSNCFVGWFGGELISLILWFKGNLEWNDSVLYAELERDTEGISSGYLHTRSEYFSSYQTGADTVINIINFCVDGGRRDKGVGSAMLRAFIQKHSESDMELFVLDSAPAALRLYKKGDFSEIRKLDGFSLGAQKPGCIQMYKKAGNLKYASELL